VNISMTPRTHPNDEVTLALIVELTTSSGEGFGGLPAFGNRKVETTIRLKDSETSILAGLIRDDERYVREGIPGLSDLPGIGRVFARNRKEAQQTDVVIMITPHVLRGLQLTEDDLRPLRVPREGGGAVLIESLPAVPVPPIIRDKSELSSLPVSLPVTAGPPTGLPVATVPPPPRVIRN
jgi:general secretion pathway protein D